jgi:AraC-like DNA-binding protein
MGTSGSSTLDLRLERDAKTVTERLALWRDVMGLAGRVHVPDENAFTGSLFSRDLGDMRTMRIAARTFRLVRDREMARRVQLDHVMVNLVERGRFVGRIGRRRIEVTPGTLLLSRLASPLDLLIEDAEWLGLFLPRPVVEKHMAWSPALDGRVFAPDTAQAIILGGLLRSLDKLPDSLPPRDARCLVQSSLALLPSCLCNSIPARRDTARTEDDPTRTIRRFIAERLSEPDLGPELVCREFEISRSRLYRIMGESADIATMIRRMRLRAVQRDIASNRYSRMSLADIGRRWGLTDERNFRRAFVREFGYPPSALREKVRDRSVEGPVDPLMVGTDLERWFLGL